MSRSQRCLRSVIVSCSVCIPSFWQNLIILKICCKCVSRIRQSKWIWKSLSFESFHGAFIQSWIVTTHRDKLVIWPTKPSTSHWKKTKRTPVFLARGRQLQLPSSIIRESMGRLSGLGYGPWCQRREVTQHTQGLRWAIRLRRFVHRCFAD